MNIGCDARALVGPMTGVGTWTAEVMGGLAELAGVTVRLAASRPLTPPTRLQRDTVTLMPPPTIALPGTLWLHSMLGHRLAAAGVQVFVGALAVIPRRCPVPAVVMLHDLTPRTHAHRHTMVNRFCFNAYLEESLDRAAAVVAGSHATERAALEAFPWIEHRLRRISYGVDEFYSPAEDLSEAAGLRRRFAGGEPFVLHLGTLEPRKGLIHLVEAWEELQARRDDAPALVLAGAPGWDTGPLRRRIAGSDHRERIHLPGYVSRHDARELLRHTACFVLASEAEGFGLPLAEAISCGAPCVASDIPPLREAGGNASLFVPAADPKALADAIESTLEPELAGDLAELAAARAPDLRWAPVVSSWHELLAEVIEDHRSG